MAAFSAKDREFVLPVRVYIEDTDAGGIVYYVNYLKFMERARTEYLRSLGYQHEALARDNVQFVVYASEVRHLLPGRVDDLLETTAAISRLGRASIHFCQQVRRRGELLCDASIKVACVTADTIKPQPLPAPLYGRFRQSIEQE